MTSKKSAICSCVVCKKEYSVKGIHTHYIVSHTEEGKEKHNEASRINSSKGAETTKRKYAEIKNTNVAVYMSTPNKCGCCGKSLAYNKRNNTYCNSSCAAKKSNLGKVKSQQTKNKISNSLSGRNDTGPTTKEHNSVYKAKNKKSNTLCKVSFCAVCNRVIPNQRRKTCAGECYSKLRSDIGKKSASNRAIRSRDEIALFELCKSTFHNVSSNLAIFDGWDADIILHDHKIAIGWNGPWHYKDMGIKGVHLKQIQNRDKIKRKCIESAGWIYLEYRDEYTPESAFLDILNRAQK